MFAQHGRGYNITGKVHKWLEEFLIGRYQQVIVNNVPSNEEAVASGVPQGSVLGVILFLIFINDLPDVVDVSVRIFADDTKVFQAVHDEGYQRKLQESLTKLEQWAKTWNMRFHQEKCKVMHIGKEVEEFSYTMTGNGQPITLDYTDEEMDLGVIVDDSLSSEQHCETAVNKANRMLGLIRRSFKHIDRDVLLSLYKSLVRPHLEYGNTIWSPKLKKTIKSLEDVQRRLTKMIPELVHLPYHERLRQLKLPTLVYRRHRRDLIQTYKILSQKYDLDESIFFQRAIDGRTRGHSHKVFKERVTTATRKNFFSCRVTELWNELHEAVVTAPDVDVFKERLDDFFGK